MKLLHVIAGVGLSALLVGIAPATIEAAHAQSSGGTCSIVYQTTPDASGSYEIHYRCTDGRRYVLAYSCKNTHCVWDYRDEQ